jgi:hypothetical protein
MTRTDQIVAIAEFRGWTRIRLTVKGRGAPERDPQPWGYPPGKNYEAPVVNYLHDLNAMHEAEILLDGPLTDDSRWLDYVRLLHRACCGKGERATAAQRAEALLRTIGKWKE